MRLHGISATEEDILITNGVCYIGSFSKALFPGLRIGWIHADRAFVDFLGKGYYDLHLRRLHRAFRSRPDFYRPIM